jgi:hypothetical protein
VPNIEKYPLISTLVLASLTSRRQDLQTSQRRVGFLSLALTNARIISHGSTPMLKEGCMSVVVADADYFARLTTLIAEITFFLQRCRAASSLLYSPSSV